jgi:hypothetical protein
LAYHLCWLHANAGLPQHTLPLMAEVSRHRDLLAPRLGNEALAALAGPVLGPVLAAGIVYVGCLPSTVQSAITFTSLARGNVAGAVCAASISNLVGVVLAPLLVALLLATDGEVSIHGDAMWKIVQQFHTKHDCEIITFVD